MSFSPGTHLLVDFYGCALLENANGLQDAMRQAATTAGATVVGGEFHSFPDRAGVTGILLLAESHISIHTWPELDLAVIDIFMCGAADPHVAAASLKASLQPKRATVKSIKRGQG